MRRDQGLIAVAAALMSDADARHYGYRLSRRARVRSGVMYPVLQRMLDDNWLEDGWEDQAEARRGNRPPRRYYTLTPEGKRQVEELLTQARTDPRHARLLDGGPGARTWRRRGLPAARQAPRA
jgi:PadR family transcriptional regulator PadR